MWGGREFVSQQKYDEVNASDTSCSVAIGARCIESASAVDEGAARGMRNDVRAVSGSEKLPMFAEADERMNNVVSDEAKEDTSVRALDGMGESRVEEEIESASISNRWGRRARRVEKRAERSEEEEGEEEEEVEAEGEEEEGRAVAAGVSSSSSSSILTFELKVD